MKVALDFETYYSKTCTISNGLDNYLKHPQFDAYMISFYAEDGWAWVGPPKDAPWEKLEGAEVFAHNRNFDQPICEHLIATGEIPAFNFKAFDCTADMSAYLGWGRSLKEATKNALGVTMKKEVRDAMKGKQYSDIDDQLKRDLAEYALFDSKACLCLAQEGYDKWPELERRLSHETTRMQRRGLPMDYDLLDKSVSQLSCVVEDSLGKLPWAEGEQKGALSPGDFAIWCRCEGMDAPASTAKDNEETIEWMQQNPKGAEVLTAMHDLRGSNALLKKVVSIRDRVADNGRAPYGMKYFGGVPTGRDSGAAGFNVQNLPQGEMYGVNLRKTIKAPEGKVFALSDMSQIEPRCLSWMAREMDLLDLARSGMDWYEAEARNFKLYDGPSPLSKHDPELRKQMKTNALGCQYMMGPRGLATAAGISFESAEVKVRRFRAGRPKLMKLGKDMERAMRACAKTEEKLYEIELPSGRSMKYFDVNNRNGLSAEICRHGSRTRLKYWPGMLLENITQGFARDVFMDRVIALCDAGFEICLRVHDEVLIELDEKDVKEGAGEIKRIMETPPDWCKSLPLHTDVEIITRYTK